MFNINRSMTRSAALDRDGINRLAPSVYADVKHDSRSEKFAFVPTYAILDEMAKNDYLPVMAAESRTRDASRRGYTKHIVRLRHASAMNTLAPEVGEEIPELVLVNAQRAIVALEQ